MPDVRHIPNITGDELLGSRRRTLPALAALAQDDVFTHDDHHREQPATRHHLIRALQYLRWLMPDDISHTSVRDREQIAGYVSHNCRRQSALHRHDPQQYSAETSDWAMHPADDDYARRCMSAIIGRLHDHNKRAQQMINWPALIKAYEGSIAAGHTLDDMPNLARFAQRGELFTLAETLQEHCQIAQDVSPSGDAWFTEQVQHTLQAHAEALAQRQEPGMEAICEQVTALMQHPPAPKEVVPLVLALMCQASTAGAPNRTYLDALRQAIAADIALHGDTPPARWNELLPWQHPLAQFAYRAQWQMLAEQVEKGLKEQFPHGAQNRGAAR